MPSHPSFEPSICLPSRLVLRLVAYIHIHTKGKATLATCERRQLKKAPQDSSRSRPRQGTGQQYTRPESFPSSDAPQRNHPSKGRGVVALRLNLPTPRAPRSLASPELGAVMACDQHVLHVHVNTCSLSASRPWLSFVIHTMPYASWPISFVKLRSRCNEWVDDCISHFQMQPYM